MTDDRCQCRYLGHGFNYFYLFRLLFLRQMIQGLMFQNDMILFKQILESPDVDLV